MGLNVLSEILPIVRIVQSVMLKYFRFLFRKCNPPILYVSLYYIPLKKEMRLIELLYKYNRKYNNNNK